ncbi:hypothetical protein F5Y01DRAFT_294546 [Xylaria sp. FL0043]|nr:hypothetical protein F5Y01DRAFT_294546 [Xylaria sp. FL0043]
MSSHTRRFTRSSGRANLAVWIEDVIREAKTTALHEKRAFREQKYDSERLPKFHAFMRLPPELRARIYFFAMEDADSPRYLPTLRAPTLALVSKQVQEEAVHVFLSQCTFYLSVPSNHAEIAILDDEALNGSLGPLYPKSPGRLWCFEEAAFHSGRCDPLSKQTRLWLQKMQTDSEELYFPNVELHITSTEFSWAHYRRDDHHETSVLSLRTRSGRLLLDYKDPENAQSQPGLQQLRENAETVARDIAARHEKHLGFCYEELNEIAKSFRYWPPRAPEREPNSVTAA